MNSMLAPHEAKIRQVGSILWVFSLIWLVVNSLAFCVVLATVIGFKIADSLGFSDQVIQAFSNLTKVPGLDSEHLNAIARWDYNAFIDHFWLTLSEAFIGLTVFVVTLIFILKIASALRRGEFLSESPLRNLNRLGWLSLGYGIFGQVWGMTRQFAGTSNTLELIYFSFVRDVCLYSAFSFGVTGIEVGLLILAMSWILNHARLMRDEQALTV